MPRLTGRPSSSLFTFHYWLPVLGWMAAIIILPQFLSSGLPSSQTTKDELTRTGLHVMEYGGLTVLLYRVLRSHAHDTASNASSGPPVYLDDEWKVYVLAFLVATLYGVFNEVQQSFWPHRQPSVLDLLADGLGAALALVGIALFTRFWSRVRPPVTDTT